MVKPIRAKQERVVEAVRHGLEGDAAVEFLHRSGFAMTVPGIARNLRAMGGRGKIQEYVNEGKSNLDILSLTFPENDLRDMESESPLQTELFGSELVSGTPATAPPGPDPSAFETTKMTLKLPSDLYQAIRLAARAEGKTRTQLMLDILTSALSRMPAMAEGDAEDSDSKL